jgi:hypothetical protein
MNLRFYKTEKFLHLAAVFGLIAALITIFEYLYGIGILTQLFELIVQRPEWFWNGTLLTFFSFLIVSFLCAWLWNSKLLSYFLSVFKKQRIQFFRNLIFTIIILIPFTLLLTSVMLQDRLPSQEGKKLFPIAADLGPIFIRTYATNGVVNHSFIEKSVPLGPKEGYAKITFKLFGVTLEHNGGWVIFLLKGVDLSKYHELRFLIQGEVGQEKIGIKAKDASGIEVQLPLVSEYLHEGKISTVWQEVIVPFSHFGNVDFSFMENFSIFTTGTMAGTHPQTIYVGEFDLK